MIGIIIAAFMIGIIAGTSIMNYYLDKITNHKILFLTLEITYALFLFSIPVILYCLKFIGGVYFPFFSINILFPLLTALAGIWVGLIFPLGSKIYSDETSIGIEKVAGLLYAADLIGACLGSLAAVIFFIPMLGIPSACIFFALLNIYGFLMMIFTG
jgi:spermidine synthase